MLKLLDPNGSENDPENEHEIAIDKIEDSVEGEKPLENLVIALT